MRDPLFVYQTGGTTMAIPNGMIKKMTGLAGQLAFKTVNAQTVVSESFIPNQTLDCYAQTYAPCLASIAVFRSQWNPTSTLKRKRLFKNEGISS